MRDVLEMLREHGVRPTAQRLAVAGFVLGATSHPTADEVFEEVRRRSPTISRATVYNTLHLLTAKGLVRTQVVREGALAFDPRVERHHHFVDEDTGEIHDVPWEALKVSGEESLRDYVVSDLQVVMRGRRRPDRASRVLPGRAARRKPSTALRRRRRKSA
jgi:Fur family iron response transcriptional regulator